MPAQKKRSATKKPPRSQAAGTAPGKAAAPGKSAAPATFPIVGIGASAGGLEALTQFLAALPSSLGMAFVFIPHLDPTHESAMTELLARQHPGSAAEALRALRRGYPDIPLALRIAALCARSTK